ncbi:hypothetical protein BH09VER1_BH09VER1_24970 [soil metagenome]
MAGIQFAAVLQAGCGLAAVPPDSFNVSKTFVILTRLPAFF